MTRNKLIYLDYESGMLQDVVAAKYNISPQRVSQIAQSEARKLGTNIRKRKSGCTFQLPPVPEHILKAYKLRLIEIKDVAERMSCSVTSAWRRLKRVKRIKKPPTRRLLVYKEYKKGSSVAEISVLFGLKESVVNLYIIKARKEDPKPYYRHNFKD